MFKWQQKLFPSRSFYIVGELNFADAHLGLPTGAVFSLFVEGEKTP